MLKDVRNEEIYIAVMKCTCDVIGMPAIVYSILPVMHELGTLENNKKRKENSFFHLN